MAEYLMWVLCVPGNTTGLIEVPTTIDRPCVQRQCRRADLRSWIVVVNAYLERINGSDLLLLRLIGNDHLRFRWSDANGDGTLMRREFDEFIYRLYWCYVWSLDRIGFSMHTADVSC